MVIAELRRIHSPDLSEPDLPPNPRACVVLIQVMLGPKGGHGEESFDFEIVAPVGAANARRGRVVVECFDWSEVRALVSGRIASVQGQSWGEVASQLNEHWCWEFADYRES